MTSLMFSCIWLLETIFGFYMDVVDNNDFLSCILLETILMDVVDNNDFLFLYLVVGKQYLDFTWMLWIIMTSLVFSCI